MVFVTGGTGMLGAHLLLHLTKKGEQVKALRRNSSNISQIEQLFAAYKQSELLEKIQWLNADINDFNELCIAIKGTDRVYHCAASVSFNPKEKHQLIANNVQATACMVNAALHVGVAKFCHVSSVAALGEPTASTWVDEQAKTINEKKATGYAISKSRAEFEVWRGIAEGLNAVIINPSVIIGAGNWNQGSPALFGKIANGFRYYTHGITGFVDVHDVCECAINLMESDISAARFVLNSENLSYHDLFSMIAQALEVRVPSVCATPMLTRLACKLDRISSLITGRPVQITKETAAASHAQSYFSASKIQDALGFTFKPIQQSIKKVADIYQAGYKFN